MKRPGSGGTSAIFLAASAMLFISGAVLLTHPPAPVSGSDPARLVAQAAAPSGSSSMITKGVLESPCENGYVYEIQTAPKDSKEPFVIKRSLNPDDPDKRWSGTVKYRRPPTTPGGKATIITLACRDKVADMIKLTRDVTNLGSGPPMPGKEEEIKLCPPPNTPDVNLCLFPWWPATTKCWLSLSTIWDLDL